MGSAAAQIAAHRRIDVGVGRQVSCASNEAAAMIWPDWRAALHHVGFDHARCTAWLASAERQPSIVVIFLPASVDAGVMHERIATPSTCTVQARTRASCRSRIWCR